MGIVSFHLDIWEKVLSRFTNNAENRSTSLRCGLHSLYVALRHLKNESGVELYRDLEKQFPDVDKKGMNLKQIGDYLKTRKVESRLVRLDREIWEKVKKNAIAFLLYEEDKIAHIVLLVKKDNDHYQIVDTSTGVTNASARQVEKLRNVALFAAEKSEDLPTKAQSISTYGLSIVFLGCGIALFTVALISSKKVAIK
jgi:hypothetical protein